MTLVDEIKVRLNIVDIVNQTVALKKAGQAYKAACPFHDDRTPSFVVWPETQTWRCFGQCNEGGDVFNFVMKRDGVDFSEALRHLAQQASVPLSYQSQSYDAELAALSDAAAYFHAALPRSAAAAVTGSRKLATEAAAWQLGYAPDSWTALIHHLQDKGHSVKTLVEVGLANEKEGRVYAAFRHRLMFPIWDYSGRIVGFGARALSVDSQPKYLNTRQTALFDKSATLYGLHRAKNAIRLSEVVVVVEGYVDAIRAHQYGFDNVVATLGTAFTQGHLDRLAKIARRVVLCLDGDAAGFAAMERVFSALDTGGTEIHIAALPNGLDPDDYIQAHPEQWADFIHDAPPYQVALIQHVQNLSAEADTPNAREALFQTYAALMGTGMVATEYLQELARALRLPEALALAPVAAAKVTGRKATAVTGQPVADGVRRQRAWAVAMATDKEMYIAVHNIFFQASIRFDARCFNDSVAREIYTISQAAFNQSEEDYEMYTGTRMPIWVEPMQETAVVAYALRIGDALLVSEMRRTTDIGRLQELTQARRRLRDAKPLWWREKNVKVF